MGALEEKKRGEMMTIGGWIIFGVASVLILALVIAMAICSSKKWEAVVFVVAGIVAMGLIFGGLWWYFHNTASGQRKMVDQKSNISGIERSITVYTANGDVIATYTGLIDIEQNDGGYIKFDFNGKRYVYYNCFVETIAEIGE